MLGTLFPALATLLQAPLSAVASDARGPLSPDPSSSIIHPVLLLVLCLVAGVGTVLLLPGRKEAPVRKIGGAVVIAAAVILALLVVRYAATAAGGGPGWYFWVFSAIALVGAVRVVTHPRPVYSALYFVLTVFATAGLFILLWAEFMAAALVLIYAGAILVTYVFVIMLASQATSPPANEGTGAAATEGGDGNGQTTTGGGPRAGAPGGAPYMGLAEYDAVSREPLVAAAVGFALMGVVLFVVFDRAQEAPVTSRETFTYTATRVITDADGEAQRIEMNDEVTVADAAQAEEAARLAAGRPAGRDGAVTVEDVRVESDPAGNPVPAGTTQALGRFLFRHQGINLELAGLILTVAMIGAILIARRRVLLPASAAEAAPAARPGAGPAVRAGGEVFVAPMTPVDDNPHSIPVYGTTNPRQKAYPEN